MDSETNYDSKNMVNVGCKILKFLNNIQSDFIMCYQKFHQQGENPQNNYWNSTGYLNLFHLIFFIDFWYVMQYMLIICYDYML